ncbi:MAG: hypothetical protein IPN55_15270 [Saprospiraceae bacterium]|nr:hypothetical protein [Candidatus Brachybacter algidus]
MPYDWHDQEMDINQLSLRLTALFSKYKRKNGESYQIWFELVLVSKCGYLIARVNVIHDIVSYYFLVCLDTGFNHLIRPMLYGAYHRIGNLRAMKMMINFLTTYSRQSYETDTFAENRMLPKISGRRLSSFLYVQELMALRCRWTIMQDLKPASLMTEGGNGKVDQKKGCVQDLLKNQVTI